LALVPLGIATSMAHHTQGHWAGYTPAGAACADGPHPAPESRPITTLTQVPAVSPSAEKRAARSARREAALALRPSMSPTGPAPDRLRVATWNLNSLRARLPAVERFLDLTQPDVLCLQETKAASVSEEAAAAFARHGYKFAHVGTGPYNGVAILARHPLEDVRGSSALDDEHLDREPRVLSCLVRVPERLRVVSIYAPHGRTVDHWHYHYKLAFFDALIRQVERWLDEGGHVVVAGDLNVAATDSDVFHPDAFIGSTHVTLRERDALRRLLETGLVDVDAARWGDRARRFTWWNHGIGYSRNLGMRLDVIATDRDLAHRLDTTWIDHTERGADRPSDHAALLADFDTLQPPSG
jgi:exodeoxyribonuclease-3